MISHSVQGVLELAENRGQSGVVGGGLCSDKKVRRPFVLQEEVIGLLE